MLVLVFSGLKPNRVLGLLLASSLASCYLTTFLFLPGLMRTRRPQLVARESVA
jgi:hypothetical protein